MSASVPFFTCPQQPSAAVQGWLVRSFHFPNTIGGCSRVAGPFFSLVPNNHLPRRSKVQPWGAALHLGTKCNCLGAADGRPSLDEQMEICGKTYVPNIYIYIYLHISGRKCGFGVIRGLASLAPIILPFSWDLVEHVGKAFIWARPLRNGLALMCHWHLGSCGNTLQHHHSTVGRCVQDGSNCVFLHLGDWTSTAMKVQLLSDYFKTVGLLIWLLLYSEAQLGNYFLQSSWLCMQHVGPRLPVSGWRRTVNCVLHRAQQ